ncbi:hypothetical protein [Metabacillus bambusae]|uniref:Uncharacterized protein n=1 Tax=Metabacillus bambusae TaxID=2795218 RepID=A0ABS3MZ42_9BACI|nr:hypothetical protein [Metabacillus bambusae]MBO1511292.1 hypothetical protein [Metabacillus bambusae]
MENLHANSHQLAPLAGKRVYLLIQGTKSEHAIPYITNVIRRLCRRFQMKYMGLATNSSEATKLHHLIVKKREEEKNEKA